MKLNLVDSSALELARGSKYCFGFWHDCAHMKTAKSRFLLCNSGKKPRFDSSNSRRSEMAISVGHFMATSPSSVGKVWTGKPSTLPPPSTPRLRAIQPYLATASVIRVAYAQAEFIHAYLSWSLPSTFSSKLNSVTFLKLLPY